MIRVLHILGGLHPGGMQSMIMSYYRNIDRTKIQFDFLVFSGKSFYDDEVLRLGGKIYRITPRRKNPFKNYRELDLFFKSNPDYKIVHIHQGINYFAPLKKARKYKIPIIIAHSHGMDPKLVKRQGIFYYKFTIPTITKNATHFVSCSDKTAYQIFGNEVYESKQYRIIRNAIDLNKYKFDNKIRENIREKFNLSNKLVIGHVGNFTYPKNHEFIIDVFEKVINVKPDAALFLIGSGPLEYNIKKKVEQLGLIDKVYFLGNRDDVHELMQAMDLLIFPSHYEGLPVVLIEAQATGLKVIASDSIDPEVGITNLIKFLPLMKGEKFWANNILEYINEERSYRTDIQKEITNAGYNILIESKKLEKHYLKLYQEFYKS